MKIKGIIFDLDGVLIDSKEWHYESLNSALQHYGYNISREDHLTIYDGLPTRKKLELLTVRNGLSPNLYEPISRLKQEYAFGQIAEKCRPNPLHKKTLATLKKLNFRMAVASNSIRQSVHTMLQLSGLDVFLEFMLSNEDVKNPKPSPEIYRLAISRLNLLPQECLILEDNEKGILAARAANAHVLVIRNTDEVTCHNIESTIQEIESQLTFAHESR